MRRWEREKGRDRVQKQSEELNLLNILQKEKQRERERIKDRLEREKEICGIDF